MFFHTDKYLILECDFSEICT